MRPSYRPWVVAVSLFSITAAAQNLGDFSTSPSPVGSGARAAGMANAFVAVADDATAASWNPAGLVQLERPEISVVGAFNLVHEELTASQPGFVDTTVDEFGAELNFLAFTYPLPVAIGGRNATLSISYQRKYDFARGFDFDFNLTETSGGNVFTSMRNFDYEQTGGLATISPAIAFEITKKLSVGVTVNIWRSSFLSENGWDRSLVITNDVTINGTPLPTTVRTVEERFEDLEGENAAIGLLWNPIERLSLGFRYDTAWTGDVDYKFRTFGTNTALQEFSEENEIEFPASYTLGGAYRFNDRLTVALDWTHADWSEFVLVNEAGERISLVTGENIDEEGASVPDATNTVRLGAEYVFVPRRPPDRLRQLWSLRGGLFYDEEPASNRPTGVPDATGDGSPDKFWGFSVGAGLQAFQRVNIDAAYQARFGFGVDSDRISVLEGFEEDVVQHRFLLSAVIYF